MDESMLVYEVLYNGGSINNLSKKEKALLRDWYKAEFQKSNRWNRKAIYKYLENDYLSKIKFKNLFSRLYNCSKKTNNMFIFYCDKFVHDSKDKPTKECNQIGINQDTLHELIKFLGEAKRSDKITGSYLAIAKMLYVNFSPSKELQISTIADRLMDKKGYTTNNF